MIASQHLGYRVGTEASVFLLVQVATARRVPENALQRGGVGSGSARQILVGTRSVKRFGDLQLHQEAEHAVVEQPE